MEKVEFNYFRPAKRLKRLLKKERRTVKLIIFYAVLNGIIALTLPLGIQAIVNYILGGRVTSSWIILIVVVVAGVALAGIFQIMQVTYAEKLQQRIFATSSFEFAVRIPRLKMSAFQKRYAPEMVNQFFDTVILQKGLAKLLIDYPIATLQIFFGLILISVYHPFFLFFSLVVIVIITLVLRYSGPAGITSSLQESTEKYKIAHWLEELARSMGTFKLAGITELPLVRADQLILQYLKFRRSHFAVLIMQFKVMIVFKVLTMAALLITGSILLIENQISLGQFVAAEIIIITIMNSIEKLIVGLENVYDVLTSLEKIGYITDLPVESEDRLSFINGEKLGFDISLENVRFQYPDADIPTVDGVNLEISSGEKVVISGPSGSGKSTLMQLLTGVYDNYEGRIAINDIPLSALRLDMLRFQIGDSLWQENIFKGTVRENITIGKADVTDDEIWEALEAVSAVRAINRLDRGLDTELMSEGLGMAKALLRKIILARSVVSSPKLLLLELESANLTLDEKEKFVNFLIGKPWTVLVVSHDGDLIRKFNNVICLEKGKVSIQSNFETFKKSEYARYIR
jgi:ABC-type bacteriocin/lantibiotic exporter with double-glycine peptidase domain